MSWLWFLQLIALIPWTAIWFSLMIFTVTKPEKVKS